jgi:hypothetical protein
MERFGDHDGKSKSASAVDSQHYPEPTEDGMPTHAEISERARGLWLEQGRPSDADERIWLQAEREMKASAKSRSLVEEVRKHSGSVQP